MSYTNNNHEFQRNRLEEPAQLLSAANFWTPTATRKSMLGRIFDTNDGRRFRYQKNGSSILTKALVNQSAAGTAGWQDEIQTNNPGVAIVGDTQIIVTMTTTAAAGAFIDGYLTVEQGAGSDEMYIVKTNKVGTANATSGFDVICEIADAGGVRVLTAVTSNITLTVNKYRDVIVFPTDPTGVATGVSHATVAANFYFWGQTRGPCPVTKDSTDTIVVGDMVGVGANTAGQACLMDIAAEGDRLIGYCMRAPANAETALIDLQLE